MRAVFEWLGLPYTESVRLLAPVLAALATAAVIVAVSALL